jgi:hypothetical protein
MLARLAGLSVLLLLIGCQTPADLKGSADVRHGRSSLAATSPEKTAGCLKRLYEDVHGTVVAGVAPLGGQAYEVVARQITGDINFTFAVFEIRPGSLEYWVDPSYVRDEQLRFALKRCG